MTADYHSLNAMLNLYDEDGNIQFDKDHEAVDAFLAEHVAPSMIRFESTRERLRYLVDHHYYEYDVFSKYSPEFLDAFYAHADALPHRFETFLGAFKFYRSYALKTFDGEHYL